jgi:hypothetical protein
MGLPCARGTSSSVQDADDALFQCLKEGCLKPDGTVAPTLPCSGLQFKMKLQILGLSKGIEPQQIPQHRNHGSTVHLAAEL